MVLFRFIVVLLTLPFCFLPGCKKTADSAAPTKRAVQKNVVAAANEAACLSLANVERLPVLNPASIKIAKMELGVMHNGSYNLPQIFITPEKRDKRPDVFLYRMCSGGSDECIEGHTATGLDYNPKTPVGGVVMTAQGCVYEKRADPKDKERKKLLPGSNFVIYCGDVSAPFSGVNEQKGTKSAEELRNLAIERQDLEKEIEALGFETYTSIVENTRAAADPLSLPTAAIESMGPALFAGLAQQHIETQAEEIPAAMEQAQQEAQSDAPLALTKAGAPCVTAEQIVSKANTPAGTGTTGAGGDAKTAPKKMAAGGETGDSKSGSSGGSSSGGSSSGGSSSGSASGSPGMGPGGESGSGTNAGSGTGTEPETDPGTGGGSGGTSVREGFAYFFYGLGGLMAVTGIVALAQNSARFEVQKAGTASIVAGDMDADLSARQISATTSLLDDLGGTRTPTMADVTTKIRAGSSSIQFTPGEANIEDGSGGTRRHSISASAQPSGEPDDDGFNKRPQTETGGKQPGGGFSEGTKNILKGIAILGAVFIVAGLITQYALAGNAKNVDVAQNAELDRNGAKMLELLQRRAEIMGKMADTIRSE